MKTTAERQTLKRGRHVKKGSLEKDRLIQKKFSGGQYSEKFRDVLENFSGV